MVNDKRLEIVIKITANGVYIKEGSNEGLCLLKNRIFDIYIIHMENAEKEKIQKGEFFIDLCCCFI
jgi:hypothetical protein